ncbi:MAG: Peptide-binding protein [Verrucomicrobiales bacterium]|nr:Peptide-binding protein [Verrucomicrobiales bacterium]
MIRHALPLLVLFAFHSRAAEPVHLTPEAGGDGSGAGLALERAVAGAAKEIVLHAGTYRLEKPLILDGSHSGLTIRAAEGESVILSGGKVLPLTWTAGEGGGFSAAVPKDMAEIDSL